MGEYNNSRLVTSESVTEGHPDKICDQISDAILDAILEQDPNARVAVETVVTTGQVHVVGEVTCEAYVEIPQIIRETVHEIGYTSSNDSSFSGFDADDCGILVSIGQQSPDIALGTGTASEEIDENQGAGDQGLMYGYACDETPELFPLAPWLAHRLALRLTNVRKSGLIDGLRPDGKTQVTIEYDERGNPVRLDTIVISTQHDPIWSDNQAELREKVIAHIIDPVIQTIPVVAGRTFDASEYKLHFNPTGNFVIGGPKGDAGLTGRKIIVDTYGGVARHGGGAFSGKDPSKVDRCAAYAMRWVAKNIVAAGLSTRCELQVSYAIGVASPVSIFVDTFGTGVIPDSQIAHAVQEVFDLRPAAIIKALDLRKPKYRKTASYGHFGRDIDDPDFTWEQTNKVDDLMKACGVARS
jgi:S-adenosylmethionine synthetase